MSPHYYSANISNTFLVATHGALSFTNVHLSNVVRPVVSLKSSVLVTGGSGTGSNPYTLTMQ